MHSTILSSDIFWADADGAGDEGGTVAFGGRPLTFLVCVDGEFEVLEDVELMPALSTLFLLCCSTKLLHNGATFNFSTFLLVS